MEIVLAIVIIIFSIILHEVAHGYAADWLGDPTARYSGRLTLNPLPHIDPIGSVLLPGILALSNSGFLIGWAKPVPYNPYNLRGGKWSEAFVGFAGPLTNILLAVTAGLILRFFGADLSPLWVTILVTAGYSNLFLAILNLVPIPPLDGSKILSALLPYHLVEGYRRIEGMTYALGPFGLIIVLMLFVFVLSEPIAAVVQFLFFSIAGA